MKDNFHNFNFRGVNCGTVVIIIYFSNPYHPCNYVFLFMCINICFVNIYVVLTPTASMPVYRNRKSHYLTLEKLWFHDCNHRVHDLHFICRVKYILVDLFQIRLCFVARVTTNSYLGLT